MFSFLKRLLKKKEQKTEQVEEKTEKIEEKDVLMLKILKNIEESLKRIENKIDFIIIPKEDKIINTLSRFEGSKIEKFKKSSEIVNKIIEFVKEKKETTYEEIAKEFKISKEYVRFIFNNFEVPNIRKEKVNKKVKIVYIS
jgi:DeoR/GlpR family transcriptional regulator of sugar metabolism